MEDLKRELKQLYAQDKDKALIKRLNEIAPKQVEDIENEIYGWIGRYQDFRKKVRRNTLPFSEQNVLQSQLGDSLLALIDELGQKNEEITKVLFLAANPEDTGQLRLGEEAREIEDSIQISEYRAKFDLRKRSAVRIQDLIRVMTNYQPTIVHFSGHGVELDSPDSAPGSRSLDLSSVQAQQLSGGIALEDEDGKTVVVSAEKLGKLFELFEDTVECVFLNACHSQLQAEAIIQHVQYVVGMNTAVPDKTAIKFAKTFYNSLGEGQDIPSAFKLAKTYLALEDFPGADIPELITK